MSASRRFAALAAAAALSLAASQAATAGGDSARPFTAERVRNVLVAVFHSTPRETLIGGEGESTLLSVYPTKTRTYLVVVTVDRLPAVTERTWRGASAWRKSGFAIARIRNVIITASPPDAQFGVNAPRFRMPSLVWEALRRLANQSA